jgi:hypothetical protein
VAEQERILQALHNFRMAIRDFICSVDSTGLFGKWQTFSLVRSSRDMESAGASAQLSSSFLSDALPLISTPSALVSIR